MQNILVIHGPNLNALGKRQPDIYGDLTLEDINGRIKAYAQANDINVVIMQSNSEAKIINAIHNASAQDSIVINPAGYTTTSVAIRDAIEAKGINTIEVHISNIYAREIFRQQSIIAPVCIGQITGFKWLSYILALEFFVQIGEKS